MSVAVVSARTAGQVIMYLNRKQPVPIMPCELYEHVTADAWAIRIPQLIRVGSRYDNPLLEGIWLILMFICALAVPSGLNSRIFRAFDKKTDDDNFDATFQTRWISTAIMIGIMLVFLILLGIWKSVGQAHLNRLIKQWGAEDARSSLRGHWGLSRRYGRRSCPLFSDRIRV